MQKFIASHFILKAGSVSAYGKTTLKAIENGQISIFTIDWLAESFEGLPIIEITAINDSCQPIVDAYEDEIYELLEGKL